MIITIIVKIGSRKVSVKRPRRMDSNFPAAATSSLDASHFTTKTWFTCWLDVSCLRRPARFALN